MQLAVIILVALLSAYFLLAAFLPDWRIRWGRMTSTTRSQPRLVHEHYRKPRMGGLACLGSGLFLAGIPTLYFGLSVPVIPSIAILMCSIGFVLGVMGQFRDEALEGQGWVRYKSRKR